MLKQNREPGGAQMMTRTRVTLILLGALIATVPGCAGSKKSSDAPSASVAPANVAGTWTGGTATGSRTVTLQLQQAGPNVTGTLAGAGSLDGPIEGTVDGSVIRLAERSGFGSTPALNVKGDQITGNLGGATLNLRRVR
jgi:hypothetical protein